ncbi:MAG TPA: hypothetical protein VF331_16215, partial [Polyangiales bacterium]
MMTDAGTSMRDAGARLLHCKTVASGAERTLDLSRHRHRLSAHSRLSVSVIKDGKEVLRSTHDIST